MKWQKQGRVFVPEGKYKWMTSHAAVPFAETLGGDAYRVYFSSRDIDNRARIGYLHIDLGHHGTIDYIHPDPIVDIGPLGSYEDCGVIGSWIINLDDKKYLFYSGLTRAVTVPFLFYGGLAFSIDGGAAFEKISAAPILDRNNIDPFLIGHVCVLIENGIWRMWYVSGQCWQSNPAGPKHYYHIKYAESDDGLSWRRDGTVCITFKGDEYAIARPCVLKEYGRYRMWYCYRGGYYKIGYAESSDGKTWQRMDDEAGIDVSETGWDSDMITYPFVFVHKGLKYMLYNGNGYGRTGFGLAVLVDDKFGD